MEITFQQIEENTYGKVTPMWGIYSWHRDVEPEERRIHLCYVDSYRPMLFQSWNAASEYIDKFQKDPRQDYVICCVHVEQMNAEEHGAAQDRDAVPSLYW